MQPPPARVVVFGLGRFGSRVVTRLRAEGVAVTVVTNEETRPDRILRAQAEGARVINKDFRFAQVREEAGVRTATAVIIASSSDTANLEAALEVRDEAPDVRIVMRLDEGRYGERLKRDFGINAVLSPPYLAAREFSHAALAPPEPITPPEPAESKRTRESVRLSFLRLPDRFHARRPLLAIFLMLFILYCIAISVFRSQLDMSLVDAIYFTTTIFTTVGFGDYHLKDATTGMKVFGMILMFAGVLLVAMLTSVVTNLLISGAAGRLRAEAAARGARNHVILCGLSGVGVAIAQDLIAQGIPMVVIDLAPDDNYLRVIGGRVPLLIGDATQAETLVRAGIVHARAVIAAIGEDPISLEIGLTAQTVVQEIRPSEPLQIVLRCFDADHARRIRARTKAYTLLSSAEIAAPLFVQAALDTSS